MTPSPTLQKRLFLLLPVPIVAGDRAVIYTLKGLARPLQRRTCLLFPPPGTTPALPDFMGNSQSLLVIKVINFLGGLGAWL